MALFCLLVLSSFILCREANEKTSHGQTITDRRKPGPSFQLQKFSHDTHAFAD